jgi:dihydroorotase
LAVQLLIKNGSIVSPSSTVRGHLVINDGKVVEVLLRDGNLPEAETTIDAQGLHVLPGLIDPHVHIREPGLEYKEDWNTGSQAAVCGGITTIIDMPNVKPMTQDPESLQAKLDSAQDRSYCDFAIYAVLVEGSGDKILPLAEAGVCGYKIFMGETIGNIPAPSDGEIIEQWKIMSETGLRCGVHAEDNSILFYLRDKLKAEGRTDPLAFLESRPPVAEAEAIQRAILFAKEANSKLMIYHMSSKDGVEILRRAKADGIVDVQGETGPHYFLFDGRDMVRMGLGSLLRMNPPVRESEHGEALFQGLLDGTIDVIGTDHSPHTREEKMYDDRMGNIWEPTSGWPGVETNVPVMLTVVNEGRMTLNQYVKVQAEGPAKAWNVYPQKGNLAPGADGDVTIVDMNKPGVIDENKLHSKPKLSPWHGWHVTGQPVYTIVRGKVVAKDGEVVVNQAEGQFIKPSVGKSTAVAANV